MGENDQLVVFAQDEDIVNLLRTSSFVFMDMNGTLNQNSNQRILPGGPGSYIFDTLTGKRPLQILHFLELGCTVLYTDIDTVWLGDVFEDIAAAGSHDLYITDDSQRNEGMNRWNFCTCFMYLQPSPAVRELMQNWHQAMDPKWHDQPPFNIALRQDHETRGLVDFAVLPYKAFPPGCYVNRAGIEPGMHVLHANYRRGI